MKKITGITIARNEEALIGDCLDSLAFCDEIFVIDNDSSDKTAEIAEAKGAKVIRVTGSGFARIRNEARRHISSEWILYVDADERVSKGLEREVKEILSKEAVRQNAFRLPRVNFYLGNNRWPKVEHLERLFKTSCLKEWYGELHESPSVAGEIGDLRHPLFHYTHRDLSSMVRKTLAWSDVEARLRLEAGHPPMYWWRFPRVMMGTFFDWYIVQGGWKVGTVGIIESLYQSFSIFITYAKLWELQKKKK